MVFGSIVVVMAPRSTCMPNYSMQHFNAKDNDNQLCLNRDLELLEEIKEVEYRGQGRRHQLPTNIWLPASHTVRV